MGDPRATQMRRRADILFEQMDACNVGLGKCRSCKAMSDDASDLYRRAAELEAAWVDDGKRPACDCGAGSDGPTGAHRVDCGYYQWTQR